ncbi:coat protein [Corn salad necrosis virus]|nr:coat protein [Corn salad necrosis virus]
MANINDKRVMREANGIYIEQRYNGKRWVTESSWRAGQQPSKERATGTTKSVARKIRGGVRRAGGFVAAPVSGAMVTRPTVPRFGMRGDSTIVSNSELILNLTPIAAAYGVQSLPLLATQPAWLGTIADNYSKWRWISLRIIYSPKCPTTTPGTVAMCLSYDRNDVAPGSRVQLSQTYKAINFPPYAGYDGAAILNTDVTPTSAIYMDVDVTRFDKNWYSTIGTVAFAALTAFDQNQFCPCTVHIGSDGGPAVAVPPGDIFLKYVIELIEPINPTMNV